MTSDDGLRASDVALVARYLQVRSYFHDRVLGRVETLVEERYQVQTTKRITATLVALVRSGFVRSVEGEVWPVVFLTPVDVSLAVCAQIRADRLASLGTTIGGPQRNRHRHWEDWWGWEIKLADVRPSFFSLPAAEQDEALIGWYLERFEWLAQNRLLQRQ